MIIEPKINKKRSMIGKTSAEVLDFLIKKNNIKKIFYRAYIPRDSLGETFEHLSEHLESDSIKNYKEIYSFLKKQDLRYLLGFQSKVLIGSNFLHIPMIDFSNRIVKDLTVFRVKNILKELGQKEGFILNSGRCFHYYGVNLLEEKEWQELMKLCCLYDEIGKKYVGHQLDRGACCLRIVTNKQKPRIPTVTDYINLN